MITTPGKRVRTPRSISGPHLAFILLGGPLAWLGQLIIAYMLASHACYPHVYPEILAMTRWLSPVLTVMTGSALALAILAFAGAWRLSGLGTDKPTAPKASRASDSGRIGFLAVAGLIVNGLFALGCLFALTAYGLIPPCG
jgi:hypothetical protein